jgi:carboxypeptidase family protein/TonB-dependent receptor-like protein
MNQSCVSAFARAARRFALAAVALALGAGSLLAQGSTGKIEGRVRDQAGAPIANAQVFIVGTAFNALTNPQGYYFMNNVPAGTYNVRAAFIGYKSTQVDGVKVLAGQTITVDVQLEQTAVQIEDITVVQNTQPLVPRDEVTTKQRVDGEFASQLPVDRINEVLQLQPGVTADNFGNLSIRGGRNREAATYVDGVPVTAGYRGDRFVGSAGSQVSLSTNAFEEASVTTGSSSAEFGNARSGIIAIVTKTGGQNYQGSLSYETDEPFGVNHSIGLNRIQGSVSGPIFNRLTFSFGGTLEGQRGIEDGFNSQNVPIFLQAGIDTTVRQPLKLDDPDTENVDEGLASDTAMVDVYQFAVSRGNCDAFANAGAGDTLPDGTLSPRVQGIRDNYGLGCQGVRLPATAKTLYQASGKLNYSYGTGSRVALSYSTSRNHGHRYPSLSPIRYLNNLSINTNLQGLYARSHVATLNWTQNLAKSAERALALDVALSYQQDRTIDGALTAESDLSTRSPTGGFIIKPLHFLYDDSSFPVTDELVENFRLDRGRLTPFDVNSGSQFNQTDDLRNNAYGLYGKYANFANTLALDTWQFAELGGPTTRFSLYKERRYIGKATLDWQLDRYNRVKVGGELTRYSIDTYSAIYNTKFVSDVYREKPIAWNGFVEDRLDLGDVVVVAGLRYDFYDTRASRPYVSDTLGNRYAFPRISSYQGIPGIDTGFDPANPTAKFVRDRSHKYLSPHAQVSFPVTERTNFRLSYSHQVQSPDFALLLTGINTDLNFTNTNQVFGTDLDFGKSITFEFGIRHAFSDDMVLDVAAYNKDIISDPAARLVRLYDPALKRANDLRMLTNLDFGNVRGLDLRIDRRFGNFFNGTISYSFQQAKNTGSDPFTYINFGSRIVQEIGGINGALPPPQGSLPTDNSRPHTLSGAFSLSFPGDWRRGTVLGNILGNFSVFTTFRYSSGTAYTKCGAADEDQVVLSTENCNREFPEGINSQRLPAIKHLDARFTKSFGLGGLDLTGYLDVRNLLNFKNIIEVWAVNGSVENSLERDQNLQADLADLASEGTINHAEAAAGGLDLTFAGDGASGCGGWISSNQRPAAANCVYLIRAEQRYGNGDGVFDVDEQTTAINALYDAGRGEQVHTEPGRRARLGIEINF